MRIFAVIFLLMPPSVFSQSNSFDFQSPENIKKFADHLFCENDYLRAVEEYESIKNVLLNDTIDFKIMLCYSELGMGCPLCLREVNFLRRRDRQGKIRFTDIDAPDFRAADFGASYEELMAQIHARMPHGTWIRGVEVFRRLYDSVGFATLVSLTRLPAISQLLDWGYSVFARNRLRLTGRCTRQTCDTVLPRVYADSSHPTARKGSQTHQVD